MVSSAVFIPSANAPSLSNPQNSGGIADNLQLSSRRPLLVPSEYPSIQTAINAAQNGDTIYISPGTYYENVVINKTVSLVGIDAETAIIDGSSGYAVQVTVDNVTIDGFTIRNGGIELIGVNGNTICGNNITGEIRMIYAFDTSISRNNITGYIWIDFLSGVSISGNNVIGDIWMDRVSAISISGNDITGDIWMNYAGDISIFGNNITKGFIGFTDFCVNIVIYHNNFVDSQVGGLISGIWDDGYPSGGNYWSDYTGVDVASGRSQDQPGSDGIGDTPYVIDSYNTDNYPLMDPWTNTDPVVSYVHVWGYPGGLLDPGGSIHTYQRVRIYAGVSDTWTASDLLDVTISYRPQGGSWTGVSAVWQSLYGGYWYYDWVIPGDAATGLYDVMVEVSDGDGGSAVVTELGEFNVVSFIANPVVNYVRVWGYPGGLLDPGGSINTGQKVRIYAGVTDIETASDLFDVTISYRVEGEGWTIVPATWQSNYGGYWYYDWAVPMGALAGLYDVMVEVSDGDGGSAVVTELGEFTVTNSDPVVNYVHVWGYPGGLLDPGGSINAGERVRIYAGVSDTEASADVLSVTISYKAQFDSEWTSATGDWCANYGGYWFVDWVIPGSAATGLYDVMVEVSDGDGGYASVTEYDEFTVMSVNADPVVNYVHVWGYPDGLLDPGGSINTGQKVRIYTGITDAETASDALDVTISYRVQGGDWTSVSAEWQSNYSGYWYCDWIILSDSPSGLYDVMVEVSDSDGGSVSVTELGEFNVVSVNADPVVNYVHVWGYPGGLLDPGGSINAGERVRIYTGVSDVETSADALSVTISYRAQSGSGWTTATGDWYANYGGYWFVDWVIPGSAATGLYDVMVEVSDGDGGYVSVTEYGEFTVNS